MNRMDRRVILEGLIFCIIWGGLSYYLSQIYPDESELLLTFGAGVPLLVMWRALSIREIVTNFVESISHERLRRSLRFVADLLFFSFGYVLPILWLSLILTVFVFMVLMRD